MNRLKVVEWSGSVTGLIGSAVLSLNIPISGYGFLLFLLSNFFWVAYGVKVRAWGLVTMQAGFTITSVTGIYRWIGPTLA